MIRALLVPAVLMLALAPATGAQEREPRSDEDQADPLGDLLQDVERRREDQRETRPAERSPGSSDSQDEPAGDNPFGYEGEDPDASAPSDEDADGDGDDDRFDNPFGYEPGSEDDRDAPQADEDALDPFGRELIEDEDEDRELSSEPGDTAILRGLDKVTAATRDFEAPVGEPVRFGALEVTVRYCRRRPPEEPPEIFAFLQIADGRGDVAEGYREAGIEDEQAEALAREANADGEWLFSGWMFASSPALNALEHPVYDVWVIDCRGEAPQSEDDADEEEEAAAEGDDARTSGRD